MMEAPAIIANIEVITLRSWSRSNQTEDSICVVLRFSTSARVGFEPTSSLLMSLGRRVKVMMEELTTAVSHDSIIRASERP